MDYKRYNIIPFAGLAVLILFFVVSRSVNRSIENQLKIQMRTEKEELLPEENVKQKHELHALRSADPVQYHITVQPRSTTLASQLYWDSTMRKTLHQSDTINRMSQGNTFKGVKTTPEQFQKKLQLIDGRIREYEQRIQNDPSDDYARQKLQDLYMLKSAVNNLEEAVVINVPTRIPLLRP